MLELNVTAIPSLDELIPDSNITLGTDYPFIRVGLFLFEVRWKSAEQVVLIGIPTSYDGREDNGYDYAEAILILDKEQVLVTEQSTLTLDFRG